MRGEPLWRELSGSPRMIPAMRQLLGSDEPRFEDDRWLWVVFMSFRRR